MSYIKCARIAGVLGNNVNTDVIYPARLPGPPLRLTRSNVISLRTLIQAWPLN